MRANGVNDSTALTWLQGYLSGQYKSYRYSNHNFPIYTNDLNTKIPATNDREFFHKYFYLIRYVGGQLTTKAGTFETSLNHLRVGPHDAWARDIQYSCFKNKRSEHDLLMKDLLDMAALHDCYVTLNLGGGGSEVDGAFGTGRIFIPGDPANLDYIQYCADFINAYGNHPNVFLYDLMNEPVNLTKKDANGNWVSGWWYDTFGASWETKYLEWKNDLVLGVKDKVYDPKPKISIGGGLFYVYQPIWQNIVDRALLHAENLDICIEHPYDKVESDYNITRSRDLMNIIGKPWYYEEYGFNGTDAPPWYSYWPWFDQTAAKYDMNACSMVLSGMTATTGVVMPDYPKYPISQEVMDSIPPLIEVEDDPRLAVFSLMELLTLRGTS